MAASAARERVSPLVRRLLREPTVDTDVADEFLGIGRTMGIAMRNRYRVRLQRYLERGGVVDAEVIRPRRDSRTGAFVEIPNTKVGGRIRCRSDLLLWMLYPEGVPGARS